MATFVESSIAILRTIFDFYLNFFTGELFWSAVLGVLISLPFTLHFARRSSKELQEEAAELRRLNSILIFGVKTQGKFEVETNSEGRIVSVNRVEIDGTMPAATAEMGLSIPKPDEKEAP